jgi:hypothetical protein
MISNGQVKPTYKAYKCEECKEPFLGPVGMTNLLCEAHQPKGATIDTKQIPRQTTMGQCYYCKKVGQRVGKMPANIVEFMKPEVQDKDYCDDCVAYVDERIDSGIAERVMMGMLGGLKADCDCGQCKAARLILDNLKKGLGQGTGLGE